MSPVHVPRPSRRGLLTVALVVAALAAGRSVEALTADDDGVFGRTFLRPVAVGETVELRYATLTPESVDGAPLLDRGASAPMQSPGLWVVTRLTVTPTLDAETLRHATFVDGRGRELTLGSRNELSCAAAVPGVATPCVVAFEVATDAAAGSHLRLARSPREVRGDDMADVDLGIGADDVRRWATRTDRVDGAAPPGIDPETGVREEGS
ncbi:hypothetical protein ACK8HX_01015 [Oryzobacter sp. R7]|uniref:hypothetical protein n=1 Tax=Oryzobacter faecalis TaxID=3388656 RepID=UPI00398CA9AC